MFFFLFLNDVIEFTKNMLEGINKKIEKNLGNILIGLIDFNKMNKIENLRWGWLF